MILKTRTMRYIELAIPSFWILPIVLFFSMQIISIGMISFGFEILLPIAILIIITSAFNSFNAVYDMKIDIINKRKRPLPSGKIKPREALRFSYLLYVLAIFLSLLTLNIELIIITILNSVVTIVYSLPPIRLKGRFLLSNITVALQYGVFPLLMSWSLYNSLSGFPFFFGFSVFFLAFSMSFTKDFEDYTGDKIYNCRTIAVAMGPKRAHLFGFFSIVLSFVIIGLFSVFGIFKGSFMWLLLILIPYSIIYFKFMKNPEIYSRKLLIFSVFLSLITVFLMGIITVSGF